VPVVCDVAMGRAPTRRPQAKKQPTTVPVFFFFLEFLFGFKNSRNLCNLSKYIENGIKLIKL
jgi:hypothetical protein